MCFALFGCVCLVLLVACADLPWPFALFVVLLVLFCFVLLGLHCLVLGVFVARGWSGIFCLLRLSVSCFVLFVCVRFRSCVSLCVCWFG